MMVIVYYLRFFPLGEVEYGEFVEKYKIVGEEYGEIWICMMLLVLNILVT